jgi:hypothetical protein
MNADNIISSRELIFLGVFAVLVFGVPLFVAWASYSDKSRIDLRSLWTHQERIDKFAIIIMGTWWVHTCSMILWTLLRTVNTADYATYLGWAIPIIAKMFAPSSGPPEAKP